MRTHLSLSVLLGLVAACAPAPPPPMPAPPTPPPPVEVERPEIEELPISHAFREAVIRGTRSESGAPGDAYWQQRVHYRIDAELDPATRTLSARARIGYRNESPDTLGTIVLNLYQNLFAPGAPSNREVPETGGIRLERMVAQDRTLSRGGSGPGTYQIDHTLAYVRLPTPLAPGESMAMHIDWSYRVPPAGTFRTAWEDALGGRAFQVAQWYPQIATYDDVDGWDTTPYLGDGEFYLEYGTFEVSLTLPEGWLVSATGVLQNPEEVLTPEAAARLGRAMQSPEVTRVVTAADHDARNVTVSTMDGRLTWRFRAEDVRDFAFATSDRYVWDATRAAIPTGDGRTRVIPVHALYRPGAPYWPEAAHHARHATEYLHRYMIPYIYPHVSVAEGPVFGMEYPMLSFIGRPQQRESLYGVIAHEVAHQWVPMMVGTREARDIWIDEGLASYLDALASKHFFESGVRPFERYLDAYLNVAGSPAEVPATLHTDSVRPDQARVVAGYHKPALLFRALRHTLGSEVFEETMRTFSREWLLRHPTQWDFFNTAERVSGRNLTWFFRPWFFETAVLNRAIESVEATDERTVRITVRDDGEIVAPVPITLTTTDGREVRTEISIEAWNGTTTVSTTVDLPAPVARVEIDPEQIFPDVDRTGNVWEAGR